MNLPYRSKKHEKRLSVTPTSFPGPVLLSAVKSPGNDNFNQSMSHVFNYVTGALIYATINNLKWSWRNVFLISVVTRGYPEKTRVLLCRKRAYEFWLLYGFDALPLNYMGGAMALWLVCLTTERVVRVRVLAGDIVLCSWARHFTLTVPLLTLVYKWVPA